MIISVNYFVKMYTSAYLKLQEQLSLLRWIFFTFKDIFTWWIFLIFFLILFKWNLKEYLHLMKTIFNTAFFSVQSNQHLGVLL